MAGSLSLTEAYELTQTDVKKREDEARIRAENAEKLNELAEDIKENGFDHRYPLTIAEVDGVMMLLDGRNRREAAKIAGIIPPVIVTDIDPKLAVHRSNNQNRDATPGQKAMATAMAFPKGNPGKRNDLKPLDLKSEGCDFSEKTLSRARYVMWGTNQSKIIGVV